MDILMEICPELENISSKLLLKRRLEMSGQVIYFLSTTCKVMCLADSIFTIFNDIQRHYPHTSVLQLLMD